MFLYFKKVVAGARSDRLHTIRRSRLIVQDAILRRKLLDFVQPNSSGFQARRSGTDADRIWRSVEPLEFAR